LRRSAPGAVVQAQWRRRAAPEAQHPCAA
jgi:hypothetical protein